MTHAVRKSALCIKHKICILYKRKQCVNATSIPTISFPVFSFTENIKTANPTISRKIDIIFVLMLKYHFFAHRNHGIGLL